MDRVKTVMFNVLAVLFISQSVFFSQKTNSIENEAFSNYTFFLVILKVGVPLLTFLNLTFKKDSAFKNNSF